MQNIFDKKLLMLKPENISESQNNLRKNYNQTDLNLLAESIKINGIIAPLAVKKTDNGKYEILAGTRRLRAAKIAGLRRIPCVIYSADPQTAVTFSLAENLMRKNLNIFEEAAAIDRLIKLYGFSESQIAINIGITTNELLKKLKLLNLSQEIRHKIITANLHESIATALLKLSISERQNVLDYIIENSLSLCKSEQYIDDILNPKSEETPKTEKPKRKQSIGDIRLFYNSLSKLVTTLQNAGINAKTRKTENSKYIEYKVRILKENSKSEECKQLKIC